MHLLFSDLFDDVHFFFSIGLNISISDRNLLKDFFLARIIGLFFRRSDVVQESGQRLSFSPLPDLQ